VNVSLVLYSGKYFVGSKFRSFHSQSIIRKFKTRNILCYDGCVFLGKMDRMKIKHTNQLEIAQKESWTPRNFPAIQYYKCKLRNNLV